MAIVGTTIKQPNETFPITIDFSAVLGTSETISSAAITARIRSDGTDVTATLISGAASISGGDVTALLAASGTDGIEYIVQMRITTSLSYKYEDEVVVKVKEY